MIILDLGLDLGWPSESMFRKNISNLIALTAGGLLPLAFAPFYWFWMTLLSIGLFFYLLMRQIKVDSAESYGRGNHVPTVQETGVRRHIHSKFKIQNSKYFFLGWFYGLGMFGVGVSWVYVSMHRFGGASVFVAGLLTILFVGLLALFPALVSWFFGVLMFRFESGDLEEGDLDPGSVSRMTGCFAMNWFCRIRFARSDLHSGPVSRIRRQVGAALLFASLWTVSEWIRSWLFTGFPWLFLGYSQTNFWLSGYSPVLGVYGVSFFVVLTGCLLGQIAEMHCIRPLRRMQCVSTSIILILIWMLGGLLSHVNWTQKTGQSLPVYVVQGNVSQQVKWSPSQIFPTMRKYQRLTEQVWDHTKSQKTLVVWPEASIPVPFLEARDYFEMLLLEAKQHRSNIVLGVPFQIKNRFYNSAVVVGDGTGVYFKRHLVPFGEFVPFEKYLDSLLSIIELPMSSFSSGKANQELLKVDGIKIAPYICYEVAFPSLVRSDLPQANVLLTMSNDAWFGDSLAGWQHLQMGQMAAQMTGRMMIFSTNNGVTALISPKGKIIRYLPRFKTKILKAKIQSMKGETPWVFLGSWPILLLCFLIIVFLFFN